MIGFVNSYPKAQNIEDQNKFVREEMQIGIDQFIEKIPSDKGIHKNHFSEWKSHVMSLVNGKIRTLQKKNKHVEQ